MREIINKLEEMNVEILDEGYEKQVLNVCKEKGIDCSFKDGNLHLDKEDMSAARSAIKDADMEVPKMIAEGLSDMAHEVEKDHEVQMARSDLYKSAKYAVAIHKMLKDHSEMDGIDGWVAAKITKAADYLGSVKHYMEGQAMQDVELAVVPVAGDMTDAMTMPQESVEVTESVELTENPAMDLLKKMPSNAASAAMKARKASEPANSGPETMTQIQQRQAAAKPERVYQDPLNIDKGLVPYSVNNKYLGKDAIVKMIQDPKTDPMDFDDPEAAIEWEKLHKPVASRAEYDAAVLKNKAALQDAGYDYDDILAKAEKYYDTEDGKASMQSIGINDEDDLMAYLMKQAGIKDKTPDKYTISSSGDATTKYTSALAALKKNMEKDVDPNESVAEEDVIGNLIGKLGLDKAGKRTGKDEIGDIIAKLDQKKMPTSPSPRPVNPVTAQKQANAAAKTPSAPPARPRSMAQDTTKIPAAGMAHSMRTAKANQKAMMGESDSKFSDWSKK